MTFDPNARPAPDQPSYAALLRQLQETQNENKQLKRTKKFGLVWEDKPDAQVERVFLEAPLLREDREKAVVTDEDAVNHVLINGDNFHALTALRATHTGKVDVIYIDPPYNTGNKDFIYNDDYVDAEDGYRHSKWLSFMDKRLRLARELLSNSGVIFVSIDDTEQARLKMLMDSIFGEENSLGGFVWKSKSGGGNDSSYMVSEHEFVLAYARQSKHPVQLINTAQMDDPTYSSTDEYESTRGKYKLEALYRSSLSFSSSLVYPITAPDGSEIMPNASNPQSTRHIWRWSRQTFERKLSEGRVEFKRTKNGWRVFSKQYMHENDDGTPRVQVIRSLITDTPGRNGSEEITSIMGHRFFNNPKPVKLLTKLVGALRKEDAVILDFFAGSGTTAHAVAELNKADGGRRQCILVTDGGKTEETGHSSSNSNGNAVHIAEEITYERVRRVLTGQDWADGKEHEPLGGNLRYFNVHMEDIQSYSERDEAAAFAPFTRSHASIASSAFTVVEEKRVDTVFGLPIDYTILSTPAGEDEVKYVVAVHAHDYELAELGEWFAALPEDTDVTIMGHWLEEVEWVKENSARVKVLDVMEQVSASRKHAKSLVYT